MPAPLLFSHKKKRITAAAIKEENALAVKKARTVTPLKPNNTHQSSNVVSNVVAMPTPTYQKQNNRFVTIAPTRLNMFFRSINPIDDNYKNMIPLISKEIHSNFCIKYNRKQTLHRRSERTSIPTVPAETAETSVKKETLFLLSEHHRCYVEDFALCTIEERVVVLVPEEYYTLKKWNDLVCSNVHRDTFAFTHSEYTSFIGHVKTNPMRDLCTTGMHVKDYKSGFGHHNYGCTIAFGSINLHVTWTEVLEGRKKGIQVWRRRNIFRDVYSNFADRNKTENGLLALLNALYEEVYGDWLQCMHLINCYYRATLKTQNKQIRDQTNLIKHLQPPLLEGTEYNKLLACCNDVFGKAITKCYTDFILIGQPVIQWADVDKLVSQYKEALPSHYNAMNSMLGYTKKKGITRNKHLSDMGYYDRQVFYTFLSMARQRNPHKMINWALVSAGSNYGRGCGDIVSRRATYLGASSVTRSFLRFVKPHASSMIENITTLLRQTQKTVWTLDNNQKGHPRKYQRFGSSNRFVKVTGRTVQKPILFKEDIGEENNKRVLITYVNQRIINPINFPAFEHEIEDITSASQVVQSLLCNVNSNEPSILLDVTGKRVNLYCELVKISDTIKFVLLPFLTGYNNSTKKYKEWTNQPTKYKTDFRNRVVKICHGATNKLREMCRFQAEIVSTWNPTSKKATHLIIPPVSLRDEIRTNGYGMAIIEILCLSGLLEHQVSDNGTESWELCSNWENKCVYLCMDGLSLDRHRSFHRKLINLPYSYAAVYKQSIVFQKALTRVIDVSGPLHIAFHMLQSIYVIYKEMLRWSQKVVQWKKINVVKVSESFDMCRQLLSVTLQELERLAVDIFIEEKEREIGELFKTNIDCFPTEVARLYSAFIKNEDSTDERRQYMKGFIIMASYFREYWKATRSGDRVMMERIQNDWIGVHFLSGKHKCVENYLNAIELEYKHIDNVALQEIQMNICVRYHEGKDRSGCEYPLHPLDEMQENVNQWTKKLIMSPDEMSWVSHSPNVGCARMCINFEETEYVKKHYDYSKGVEHVTVHRSSKTTCPRKTVECERLYEFFVGMFGEKVPNRKCTKEDGDEIIANLKTQLKKEETKTTSDALEECINNMFGESMEETEIEIHDDYTGIPNVVGGEEEAAVKTKNKSSEGVNKIALGNVFEQGNDAVSDANIAGVRKRKKDRIARTRQFFLEVNDAVTNAEEKLEKELDKITNVQLFNPWYRETFRLICNKHHSEINM